APPSPPVPRHLKYRAVIRIANQCPQLARRESFPELHFRRATRCVSGIEGQHQRVSRLTVLSGRWRTRHRLIDGRVQSLPIGGHRLIVEIKSLGESDVTHWNRIIGANQSRHFSNPSWV